MYGLASLTTDLAGAIQRFEGACGTAGCRNNNPGNLRAGPGAVGVDSRGIAIFPDLATGEAALNRQVDLNIGRGLSLSEFFAGKEGVYAGYAPAADQNNPAGYAATVAGWLGIDPNTPLGRLGQNVPSESAVGPSISDSWAWGGAEGSGISGLAWVGLGIAGIGILWAVMD